MMRRAALLVLVVLALSPARGFAADPVTRERLPNGFTVIVRENPLAPVVAVSLLVDMGTRLERPEQAGISNFVHAVMVKGTQKRSGAAIAERIAALGGKLSAAGESDYSEIRGTALARFWRDLLGLTAELALEPKLAPDDVPDERDYVLSRVQRRADSPASRAFDEFYATLYGAHPYALPVLGTRASLARIDHAAVVAHYRAFYRPERMVLAVSGQVTAGDVLAETRRLFGAMPGGAGTPDPPIPAPVFAARRVVVEAPAQQVQILSGGLAPSMDHADHAAVKVLGTVLGGGMAGRLFAELRDRRGLAYNAAAYYDPVRGPGALVLYLGTAPDNALRAEEALKGEIARIKREPVSAEELARAKGYLLGRYAMDRRTNERQAWYLAFYELARVGADYPERYRRAVEAVTAADVQRAAQRYLAAPTTLVLRPK
ncbi:MAG: insulinase family protein [Candidatus Rokubacteria bacterium]|nr:insulinase family protein [Candidatus Rokubacteria bacterium]